MKHTIHCSVCLNQGRSVAATTTIHGYSVCAAHVDLVSQPEFDIFTLRGGKETRGTAV